MSDLFRNHSFSSRVLKHKSLPLYMTDEFDFFRCLKFEDKFYRKTVSNLHRGNLRESNPDNRYSKLFPGKKTSYWADSVATARAEVKKHGSGNNLLTFWAYDDSTSTFPTLSDREPLIIIDGRELGFLEILEKIEIGDELSAEDKKIIKKISNENPDCLAYESHAKAGGVNFLFFEKGFRKLAIREVRLRLGDAIGKNTRRIVCAHSSDYTPSLESYGEYFLPLAKIGKDEQYEKSEEYLSRSMYLEIGRIQAGRGNQPA